MSANVPPPSSFARVLVVAAAIGAALLPAANDAGPRAADAAGGVPSAGLVALCTNDAIVRVGAINESDQDLVLDLEERTPTGGVTAILGSNASDQLRAAFPITIPARTKYHVQIDLPVPATKDGVARTGGDRFLHGTVGGGMFLDSNGVTYRATGGTMGRNGQVCASPTTTAVPSSSTSPTTTAPASTTTTTVESTTTTTVESTTTTTAPPADLVAVAPRAVYSTINSQNAKLAVDGDPATSFVTQMAEWALHTWAWWTADLGEPVPLREIRWVLAAADTSEQMSIEVSDDGRSWSTIAGVDDDQAGVPITLTTETTTRLVRFRWRAPSPAHQLGHLAEVSFRAAPGFVPSATVVGPSVAAVRSNFEFTVEPSVPAQQRGDRYTVQSSSRSSNSPMNASRMALDGKNSTAYRTAMTVPPTTGWVSFDLGSPVPIGELRWKFSQVGFADAFRVQVSDNGTSWRTIAKLGNAPAPDQWQVLTTERTARFVRFYFYNPNQDPDVGFLSEVRFYPPA